MVVAGLGQVSAIFTGGGTLVAWAFGACADAGIAGVGPAQLVRRNFFPVCTGIDRDDRSCYLSHVKLGRVKLRLVHRRHEVSAL